MGFPAVQEDWAGPSPGRSTGMERASSTKQRRRRVWRSSALFRRAQRRSGKGVPSSLQEQEDEKGWDVFEALNTTFNKQLGTLRPQKPLLQLHTPFKSSVQGRLLPAGVSARDIARQLLAAPRRTFDTCQQTVENCQANLESLGQVLQTSIAATLRDLPARLPPPDAVLAGRPSPPHNTNFATRTALRVPVAVQRGGLFRPEELLHLQGNSGDFVRSIFAGLLGAHDMAALERMINSTVAETSAWRRHDTEPATPNGPLQREAKRRKEALRRARQSSLREPGRRVAIYTTASLPWMTGTAVNPLLRAAYLAKDATRQVTLVVPWLAPCDQSMVFPNNITFARPEDQEAYVRAWVEKRTGLSCKFKLAFYPGRYAAEKGSILPVGDPTRYIPDSEADVAVLEEPEHLNWYHHGRRWTDKFPHVVGIIHTNYLDYAAREEGGSFKARALALLNQLVCRMHCHKVVKLSDAVQVLPRQTTQFVHGVPESFLSVGEAKAKPRPDGAPRFLRGAYFIGKAIWAKGYTELLDLMEKDTRAAATPVHIDCFGFGDDLPDLRATAVRKGLDMQFHGARDHLDASMHEYRVFVNPSTSDVVATTTAEALAMGKWVVVADLPCNRFFASFPNCLTYRTPAEFSAQLRKALANEPAPMSAEERRRLTWEDATERFLDVAELRPGEAPGALSRAVDRAAFAAFNAISGVEPLRELSGAGSNTRDNPPSLRDFNPSNSHAGGIFDSKKRALARAQKL